jgi:hypothetical protein
VRLNLASADPAAAVSLESSVLTLDVTKDPFRDHVLHDPRGPDPARCRRS